MKTLKYFIPVITCLLTGGMLSAQVAVDPITGVYKTGGTSELFISHSDNLENAHRHHACIWCNCLKTVT